MRAVALAAALAAAMLLPGEPLGIGVTLIFLLVVIAAATSVRPTLDAVLLGMLAIALAIIPAIRDAPWLVALDLTAAWLLLAAAVSGPTLVSVLAPLLRLRQLPQLAPEVPSGIAPVVRGTLMGGALLTPFGVLFWTADAAFAGLGQRIPFPSVASLPGRVVAGVLVFSAATGLALAAKRPVAARLPRVPRTLSQWEWAIPLALLNTLFLAFVVVQVTVLFGGREHVLRTSGLTYAEYARQGFWQLLAAAALTFAVVGAAVTLADTPRRSQRLILRLLLGALCILTIVVVVSALRRLLLYEDTFGLTRLRLLAEAACLWFGAIFVLLIASGGVTRIRRQLARIVISGTAAGLLAFSLVNPDGWIAARNVDRWRETGRLDVAYLQTLSADAVPAIATLPPGLRTRALAPFAARLTGEEPWSSYNRSRARARTVLANAG